MPRKKRKPEEESAVLPEILTAGTTPASELPPSPVDRLPGKRRGRPRKVRVADAAEAAIVSHGGERPADLSQTVKAAVESVLKKRKTPGPTTTKGIIGLAKQVARSTVRRAVQEELGGTDADPGLSSLVRETLSEDVKQDVAGTDHGQNHPFWHLMRLR